MMMSEWILRRVPKIRVDLTLPTPVHRDAFGPNDQDSTGLSVYLASAHPNPETILARIPPEKRNSYYIVQIPISVLFDLGLSIITEEADIPGHAVIPELSRAKRLANRSWANEIQAKLAEHSMIVFSPPPDSPA
jgi:hypothetical protein